ncbi:Pimeloyl-ACP methyl ester carboxylesterase [Amycolatopsis arida]|uniref:Pimeloyl-ACP methyl ester carboxylesterase n=1 Tax=Amycolatopsis arida TaxID=587909 RepID=A0A1I6ALH0_9PSEU|nr:alpha/beta fold hydrolase [Amycolatopsis arida]TDX87380.1 pimeloyl-ACP methyl ester carboxylesterase [Amycolatopsis arida]SFQ69571.1 Pimeloyl-ACP methyl ester carboxylesterase [Amycolatopsis arida]
MIYKTEAGEREILRRYEHTLVHWPVPAERLRVPTREGDTFVLVCGPRDAPPLLLFHGSGSNATMWMGDVPAWAQHFRVHAVDMIGEPGLSAPARPPLDSPAYARWLDDVLDHLGLDRAAVVGASLGGWLALDYATRQPDRVEKLALLCPGGVGRQKIGFLLKVLLYKPFGRWGTRRSIKAVAGVDTRATPEVAEYLEQTFTHFLPRRDRLPVFPDDALRRLTMPVLVIVGGRDAMFDSYDTAERVNRSVPHASVTVLPDVGHAIIGQTQPILEFLRA